MPSVFSFLDSVSTGPLGLLLGGIVGLILTVFFEDQLKKTKKSISRRVRRSLFTRKEHERHTSFKIGPLTTGCLLIDGDGENEIKSDNVELRIDHRMVDLPHEVSEWREELEKEHQARRDRGEQYAWNGLSYAVASFAITRTALDESPGFTVRLKYSDYYTFLAAQQLDRKMRDGTTLREKYLTGKDYFDEIEPFLSCSFGTNVALVTRDYQLVVSRRSSRVLGQQNRWSSSANEALSRTIDSQGRSVPDIFDVARRGLREELAIEPHEYELKMLAFTLTTSNHQWGCTFVARLLDVTARELEDRWTRGEADGWEHSEHRFLRFDPDSVLSFMLSPAVRDCWTPHGPAVHYLALVNEYGRSKVESVAKRVVARLDM